MASPPYGLLIGALCVWRVTHLLQAEDGPFDAVVRLRRLAGPGFWGALMDCFACLSVWIAAPFAVLLAEPWRERLLLWPALSAAAILIERVTSAKPPPALYVEEPPEEGAHVVLRSEAGAVEPGPAGPPAG